ncbi:MAG TPA: hypothetical protein VFT55_15495 [Planctomycetota bacterium]|nr:hypothetical protein [Planctomycetota bacterium]
MPLERLPYRACPAACLFVLTTSAVLVAQDGVARAIEELQNLDRQPHAFAVLQAAGEVCVPPLRSLLARVGTADEPRPEQLLGALYVLGCMGKPAVSALAEVMDAFRNSKSTEVRNQSVWTMTRLALASRDAEVCRTTMDALQKGASRRLDSDKVQFAYYRLGNLGPEPTSDAVLKLFRYAGQAAAAAAAAAADLPRLDGDLLQALDDALELAIARPATPWLRRTYFDPAGGEIAAALWRQGHRNAKTARGLLQHWDPRSRHAGLQALLQPLHMTVEERLDVVSALWDRDRLVREQALANLQSYGRHGLLALRALRVFEKHPSTIASAPIYQRAAVRLLRDASTGVSDVAAAMLQDADLILRGEPARTEAITSDDLSCKLLADIVTGCRGEQEGTLEALARLAIERKAFADPADDLLLAFVASLGTGNEASWHCAARALAVLGPRVGRRLPDFTEALLQSRTSFEFRPNPDIVFVVEAEVLAGQGASVAELREAMDSPRWHVVLHALVESMQRNAIAAQDAPRLRALLSAKFASIGLTLGRTFVAATGAQPYSIEQAEQSEAVRLVAALALASLGETPWADRDVASALADAMSLESSEVPAAVAEAIKEARLPALAQKIEAKAHSRMRWPRFR